MIGWVEASTTNFNLIVGRATAGMKCVTAGSKLTKKAGFDQMAQYVNQHCGTFWTTKEAGSKWKSHMKLYKKVQVAYYIEVAIKDKN